MPSSGAIRAGRAFVELFTDNTKLVAGLRAASARLKAFGAGVSGLGRKFLGLGAAIGAPLIGAAVTFARAGDQINKMEARTGIAAATLSQLGFAAEQSGSNLGTLEKGIRGMQRSLLDASRGSAEAVDSLTALGLSVADLAGLSPDEQFKTLADRLAGIADPSLKAALAMKLFGKAGAELVPLLSQGSAGIEALQREADRLGITIDTKTAQSAADLTDAFNRVKNTLKGVAVQIGSAVAPVLTDLANRAAKIITTVIDWAKQNKPLVATILKVAAGIAAFGGALIAIGGTITAVGVALGGIASAVGLLLSPLGLAVAAVVGLGVAFFTLTDTGQQAFSQLSEFLGDVVERVKASVGGIANAIKAGKLDLAFSIVTANIRLAWATGLDFLVDKWDKVKLFLLDAFDGLKIAIIGLIGEKMWFTIQEAWIRGVYDLETKLYTLINLTKDALEKVNIHIAGVDTGDPGAGIFTNGQPLGRSRKSERELRLEEELAALHRRQFRGAVPSILDDSARRHRESAEAAKARQNAISGIEQEIAALNAQAAAAAEAADAANAAAAGHKKAAETIQENAASTAAAGGPKGGVLGAFNPTAIARAFSAKPLEETARNTRSAAATLEHLYQLVKAQGGFAGLEFE